MEPHYKEDKVVSPEEVRRAEKHLILYSKVVCKIMNVGQPAGSGQPRRCARALVGNYTSIPTLQGLRKDHKGNKDGRADLGPKLRPLAAANEAPIAALGNLVC